MFSTSKNLASNREKSEVFDAYRNKRHIIKTYLVFKIVIKFYQNVMLLWDWQFFLSSGLETLYHIPLWTATEIPENCSKKGVEG